MSLMNRLGNAFNPYQGKERKVLCLCSAGLLRSPTAANVLHQQYGYNTRAPGVAEEYALIPVDEVLLEWADEIVCVEPSVRDRLLNWMGGDGHPDNERWTKKITVLNIPDNFSWNDPELRKLIIEQYQEVGGE